MNDIDELVTCSDGGILCDIERASVCNNSRTQLKHFNMLFIVGILKIRHAQVAGSLW